ncbi:MAG: acyl--CoA ligase, partial [Candidatus Hydrogenedentes bacterium]|nr:acyl--CoA ligase [Candidatus Hydrogenedentota bacterium]
RPDVLIGAAEIRNRSGDESLRIVDARAPEEYRGDVAEVGVSRNGHIPGATNLDWTTLLEDGWFRTGDVGRFVAGRLRITGRKKDLIIRGGVNVSPAAVEEVVATHPAVRDVAVVGVPHPVMGEDVVAVVCHKEGASFDAVRIELAELCASKLSRAKQPASFVPLADLPRTTSGKIQKAKLRTFLKEGGKPVALAADPAAPALAF